MGLGSEYSLGSSGPPGQGDSREVRGRVVCLGDGGDALNAIAHTKIYRVNDRGIGLKARTGNTKGTAGRYAIPR